MLPRSMFGLSWLDKYLFLANLSIMIHSLALADISNPPKNGSTFLYPVIPNFRKSNPL